MMMALNSSMLCFSPNAHLIVSCNNLIKMKIIALTWYHNTSQPELLEQSQKLAILLHQGFMGYSSSSTIIKFHSF